jgi:hypothetical protein
MEYFGEKIFEKKSTHLQIFEQILIFLTNKIYMVQIIEVTM